MIQLLPRCAFGAGYTAATSYTNVLGGMGNFPSAQTFGVDYAKTPVALDSTFRNLALRLNSTFASDVTLTLMVDGVASTQAVTVAAGSTVGTSAGADVVVTAGQDVMFRYNGPSAIPNPGNFLGMCIEREGVGNIYGMSARAGSITDTQGYFGGAFNNGIAETYDPLTPTTSNTYSITAVAGTITKLVLRTYAGAPGAATWTGYLAIDGVIQDGTGGTVDTSCVMTGSDTDAESTFSLPVVLGDKVEIVIIRTGGSAAFALAQVAAGIGFVPTTADRFMLCGGNNNVIANNATNWTWPGAYQLATPETPSLAPISPSGLSVVGLYVERADPPAEGTGYVHTLRRSGTDTPVVVTVSDLATSGLITGLAESYAAGQTITLQSVPVPVGATEPQLSQLHWGLEAFAGVTPEPTPTYGTETVLLRRLRQAPHLSHENQWTFHRRLQIDMETGVGLSSGQGSDPQVMVSWSDDGGHTWSNEHWVSAGRMGEYTARVILRNLGRTRDRVYRVVVSDPVAWNLIASYIDVDAGTGA